MRRFSKIIQHTLGLIAAFGLAIVPFFVFGQQADFGTDYLTGVGLGTQDIRQTVINIIRVVYGILGVLTLILIVYAGYTWMTSGGRPEAINRAKKIIINAVIGLLILILAAAITEFVFSQLVGRGIFGDPSGSSCSPRNSCVADCTYCDDTGTSQFDSSCFSCTLGSNGFELRSVQTSHGGSDPKLDVHLCSRVQPQFNNSVNSGSVPGNATVNERLSGVEVSGTWQTSGNALKFTPDNNFAPTRGYEVRLYDTLADTSGDLLEACNGTVCEGSPGTPPNNYFAWHFDTGISLDTIEPSITSAYPKLDGTSRTVSRTPTIDVTFNEEIDFFTISDGGTPARPQTSKFTLQQLDGPGGIAVGPPIDNAELTVSSKAKGFRVKIDDTSTLLLEPFTWYSITVQDIEDLCANNQLPSPVTWEFQTNDSVPGITDKSPTGSNSCPNETILFTFGTAMFNELITLDVDGTFITLQPDDVTTQTTVTGFGTLRVLDPRTPVNNGYRNFEFTPETEWTTGQTYNIVVTASVIVDNDGNTLREPWSFTVAAAEDCTCTPYITSLSPISGPVGQCLTINGRCFEGTDTNSATVSAVRFIDPFDNSTGATITTPTDTYIVTNVPSTLSPDVYSVEVESSYADPNYGDVTSNRRNFTVTSNAPFTGPCLTGISPGSACHSAAITLSGTRLTDVAAGNRSNSTNNVNFSASGNVPETDFNDWTDAQIQFDLPTGFLDSDVSVTAGGQQSNSLPFDVSCSTGAWCSSQPFPVCSSDDSQCSSNSCDPVTCTCNSSGGSGGSATFKVIKKWPNCDTACPESIIAVEFGKDPDAATISDSSVTIARCDDDAACNSYTDISKTWTVTGKDVDFDAGVLDEDQHYRVILRNSILDTSGASLGGLNMDENGDGDNDAYTWVFHTKIDGCDVTSVDVVPDTMSFASLGQSKRIIGRAMSDQGCFGGQPVISSALNWFWTQDDVLVAEVTYDDDDGNGNVDPQQTVFARGIGNTFVRGSVQGLTYEDSTDVTVALSFTVDDEWPTCSTACLNSELGARFSSDADRATVTTGNIDLYVCNDGDVCNVLTATGFSILPSSDDEILLTPDGLSLDIHHRVVLHGGPTGIRGVNGEEITNLNYDSDGDLVDDAYSWIFKTQATGCSLSNVSTQPSFLSYNALLQDKTITGKAITDDGCVGGQYIDAWDYNWAWSIDNTAIATMAPVDSDGDGNIDPVQTVTSQFAGATFATGSAGGYSAVTDIDVSGTVTGPLSCDGDLSTPICDPSANLCTATTYCNRSACTCDVPPPPSVVSVTGNLECLNSSIKVVFSQQMKTSNSASYFDLVDISSGTTLPKSVSSYNVIDGVEGCTWSEGCTVFIVSPTSPFPEASLIDLVVKASAESTYSQQLGSDVGFGFTSGSALCQLDGVEVQPASWFVDTDQPPRNTNTFTALPYSNFGGVRTYIIPMSEYVWDWSWTENDPDNLITPSPAIDQNTVTVSARGQNSATITANAVVTTDNIFGGDHLGRTKVGSASITVFVCDFPWPDRVPYSIGWNATMMYCRGNAGEPLLATIAETHDFGATSDLLLDKIFRVEQDPGIQGNDLIGLRVYDNPGHASAAGWYEAQDFPQGSPRSAVVDGYEAVVDGRSTYIHFTDANSLTIPYNITSYILVLSHNQDSIGDTEAIYSALLDGMYFNNNLVLEDKQNIQIDIDRIGGIGAIAEKLVQYQNDNGGALPDLGAGTFISGVSTSRWPLSWNTTLGNALGFSMPIDPINEFAFCPQEYDQQSCYNEALDPDFYCAEGSHIYIYSNGNVYANPEFKGAHWVGIGTVSGDTCGSFGLSTSGGTIGPAPTLSFGSTPPVVTITSPPSGTSGASDVTIYYTISQPGTVSFTVDGSVRSTITVASAGSYSYSFYGLAIGGHTLGVDITNSAGTDSDSISYTAELTSVVPIEVSILSPLDGVIGPPDVTLTYSLSHGDVIQCRSDDGTQTTTGQNAGTNSCLLSALGDGVRTLTVEMLTSGTQDSVTYEVNSSTPPPATVTIDDPPDGSTGSEDVTLTYTISAGDTIQCRSDDGVQFTTGQNAGTHTCDLSDLSPGTRILTVEMLGSGVTDTITYTVFSSSPTPTVTIDDPPDGSNGSADVTMTYTISAGDVVQCRSDDGIQNTTGQNAGTHTCDLNGLSVGTRTLTAEMVNAGVLDSISYTVNVVTPPPTLPLVTLFNVTPGSAIVDFAVDSTATGHIIDRVEVWIAPDNGGSPGVWQEVSYLRTSLAHMNVSVTSGQIIDYPLTGTWWYGFHVVDTAGNVGTEAAPIQIVQKAPTDVTPPGISSALLTGTTAVDAIIDAIVTDDTNLGQIQLERIPDKSGLPDYANALYVGVQTISGASATVSFVDTPGVGTWWYRVKVFDAAGNITTLASPLRAVVPAPSGPPADPSGLTAVRVFSGSNVDTDLSWTDNATTENEYVIEYRDSTSPLGVWSQLAILGQNITSYTDTKVNQSATFVEYRVFARNTNGSSGFTNVASISLIDTTNPIVGKFSAQPRVDTDPVVFDYTVSDDTALLRAELWRAPNVGGVPGKWTQIQTTSISGTIHTGTFTDDPPDGSWWYGLHAVDALQQNIGTELTSLFINKVPAGPGTLISLNPSITYQTINGWEAMAWIEATDSPEAIANYWRWQDSVLDGAVNAMGINRLRIEIKSGEENTQDHFSDYIAGKIPRTTWKTSWYQPINDDNDPFTFNWSGFQFSALDFSIDEVVLPLRSYLAANGESLYLNLNYVDFGAGSFEHYTDPEEYAEYITAAFIHMDSKYGFVPDAVEVILEPDLASGWSTDNIANAIIATANRLESYGYTPDFIAPSTTKGSNAHSYFDAIIAVPGVSNYISEISYHRYSDAGQSHITKIADRGNTYGLDTSMLEWWVSSNDYNTLHEDLKLGNNSSWQQGAIAAITAAPTSLYHLDLTNITNPNIIVNSKSNFFKRYYKNVRRGAVRIEATSGDTTLDPIAFINSGNSYTVILKSTGSASFDIAGLPAGTYGVEYTTNTTPDGWQPDITIADGEMISRSIPAAGVITIYAK
ncbi:MAG: Ig-like domain-containing protein [Patescibacteria group bacterium]